jgi:hypothetical protein
MAQTPKNNTTNTMQKMTMTMSTLTQSSLNNLVISLRKETEQSIQMKNMETSITTAVVTAIRNNPTNMELEQSESASMDSNQTATTTKSVMDRLDSLTQIVKLLTIEKNLTFAEPGTRKGFQQSPPAKLPISNITDVTFLAE